MEQQTQEREHAGQLSGLLQHEPDAGADAAERDEPASSPAASIESNPPAPASTSNSNSNSGKKLARPIIRSAQACSQCRSHKIRCVPGPDPEQPFPCNRCIAQNLTCEVLKHNRGRKRKQPPGESEPPPEKRNPATYYSTDGLLPAPNPSSASKPSFASSAPQDNGNLHMLEQAIALSAGVPGTSSSAHSSNSFSSPRMGGNNVPSKSQSGLQPVYMRSPRTAEGSDSRHQRQSSLQGHLPPPSSQSQQHPYDYHNQGQNIFSSVLNQASTGASVSGGAGPYGPGASSSYPHPSLGMQYSYGTMPSIPPSSHSQPDALPAVPLTQSGSQQQGRGSPATQNRNSSLHPAGRNPTPVKQESSASAASAAEAEAGAAKLEKLKFPFLLPRSGRTGRRGMFSLSKLVPSEQVEEVGPGSTMTNWTEQTLLTNDPVQIGVLSLDDAKTLFQLFMDEMGTMNALLDPAVHTHDYVRAKSKFLYCAILSVISRYLNSTTYAADGTPKRLLSPVYVYSKKAATTHLRTVLGNVETSLEVVQGLTILTFHKDPEDEKACLNLYRAIAIARELGIDQARQSPDMSDEEKTWTRIKQRVWLSLFVANTILTMQFDMNVLIGPDDPAISASSRFAIRSPLPTDTLLCASVQLRRLYHIYSDMAKSLETFGESQSDKAAKLVSLSLLTRTANRELEQALRDWKEECSAAGLVRIDSKLDIWVAAIKLKLNLTIVQMSLPGLRERATVISGSFLPPKNEPVTDGPRGRAVELGCINAFHHSIAAACQILQSMPAMAEKKLLSFAADTFLSFSLYSAFFLWTLCRDTGPTLLQEGEIDHCYSLIDGAAKALEAASLYPGDSPGLHARFLRALLQARSQHRKHNGATVAEPNSSEEGPSSDPPVASNYVHPTLEALSRLQPAGANPPPPPNASQSSTGPPRTANGAADIDSVLMADWNAMQRDFPWAFNEHGIPFLDGNPAIAPMAQQQAPQFDPSIQPAYAQMVPGAQQYDFSFLPRNGGSWP